MPIRIKSGDSHSIPVETIYGCLRPLHREHLFEESAWLIRSDAATTVTVQAIRAPSERIHFYFGQGTAFQMY